MKILVFLSPLVLFLIFLYMKMASQDAYILLIREDSAIEYAQASVYFLSSMFSFFVAAKFLKNKLPLHGILYCILAIGLFFTAMEEISWGQRIFNLANPDYFQKYNTQHEISVHNLDVVQPLLHKFYILAGAYGAFAWILTRRFLPRAKKGFCHIADFIIPDWFISSYFFFAFFVYTLLSYITQPYAGGFLLWRDQEIAELLLSLGFLSFVITNCIKLRTNMASRSKNV